ncbi:hypothetical protein Tco_0020370 [Tanacetum coccineum]
MQKKEEEKRIAEEQAAKERYWKIPICDDDDDYDYTIAITPVLSTEEPVNSLIMEDEHLDTIPATESDEFIKSSVEILVPIPNFLSLVNDADFEKVEMTFLIKDDTPTPITLREKLLNVNLLIANIEALKDNPAPSSDVVTKSTSTFPNLFLEETNTFDNSMPEWKFFFFNLEEPSSGNPTTPSDLSLPDYEAFSNDHNARELVVATATLDSPRAMLEWRRFSYSEWIVLCDGLCDGRSIGIQKSMRWQASYPKQALRGSTPTYRRLPDCEDSQFCHSSRVSHLQLHLGIRYPNLID